MRLPKIGLAFAVVALGFTAQASAEQFRLHRLKVAAHPAMGYREEDVDDILREMSLMIQKSYFNWDVPCSDVAFVRDGNMILNSDLPLSGTADELEKAMVTKVPSANVIIVQAIKNCAGVQAAGCATLGTEGMAVIDDGPRTAMVWLHERGHVVGRGHVQEGALPQHVPQSDAMRVMFWNPTSSGKGKSKETCDAFRHKNLASIINAQFTAPSAGPQASPNTFGLTPEAFAIIDSSWQHGMPVDRVKTLKDEDLESIRNMLRGEPNYNWPHAIAVLAFLGKSEDAALIIRALEMPLPAAATDNRETRQQVRTLQRIKATVPEALGILVNRTKDAKAIQTLWTATRPSKAAEYIGQDASFALRAAALEGLIIGQVQEAKVLAQAADGKLPNAQIKSQFGETVASAVAEVSRVPGTGGPPMNSVVPPADPPPTAAIDSPASNFVAAIASNPSSVDRLAEIDRAITTKGIEGYLRTMSK